MIDEKILELISKWLNDNPAFQTEIKDGDPQIAALCQFIASCQFTDSDTIVDFGCGGAGIFPSLLEKVLPLKNNPFYYAVDFSDIVEQLCIPKRLKKNERQKYTVDEYFDFLISTKGNKISYFILRNVLHEMNILDTANLFYSIIQNVGKGCKIYIQDLTDLPRFERGNVGWNIECFSEFIKSIGFQFISYPFEQKSFSGNRWFSCVVQYAQEKKISKKEVESHCLHYREEQKKVFIDKLNDEKNKFEIVKLNHNISALTLQENDYNYRSLADEDNKEYQIFQKKFLKKLGLKQSLKVRGV